MLPVMASAPNLVAPDKRFRVSATAREIVDAVYEVLDCGVMLSDAETGTQHFAMLDGNWLSGQIEDEDSSRPWSGCVIQTRISDRWTLLLSSLRPMHPDARSVARWAAENLAPLLPRDDADDERAPPFGGGGGSGGSAEVGIPLWWARKARS
jgi:hypothetical protein